MLLSKYLMYLSAHHELVASALAVKAAHEINPDLQVGCMMAMTPIYPYSCSPDDMLQSIGANHKRFWFADVHARGRYPGYMKTFFERKGFDLDMTEDDLESLKQGCVDYIGLSYYMSFVVKGHQDIYLEELLKNWNRKINIKIGFWEKFFSFISKIITRIN